MFGSLRLRSAIIGGCGGLVLAALAGCGTDSSPLNAPTADNLPKPPESVTREQAPTGRSQDVIGSINRYRAQTYGTALDVEHRNVAYTAALRHAAYLNTVNSVEYSPSQTGISGAEGRVITTTSTLEDLRREDTVPAASPTQRPYPALYTNTTLYNRLAAVVGGRADLSLSPGVLVMEDYVFNGNIPQEGTGNTTGQTQFRGFNMDLRNDADPTQYEFNAADALWYSMHGRLLAMRPTVRYMGYAEPNDKTTYPTPWPLFRGRFKGVWTSIATSDLTAQLGKWPNDLNVDVNPYGLDTDIGGTVPYAGPPIHLTLPVAEPLLLTTTTGTGSATAAAASLVVGFRKMDVGPDGVAQTAVSTATKQVKVFLKGGGGGTTQWFFAQPLGSDAAYEYEFLGSLLPIREGWPVRDGEIFIVPVQPLEPNSWYEVAIQARTVSYFFRTQPNDEDPNGGPVRWVFKTNNNTAPEF